MTPKTEQLQVRVTPDEKAKIRAAAEASGLDLSSYVLARVLPQARRTEFEKLVDALAYDSAHRARIYLAELEDCFLTLPRARAIEVATVPAAFHALSAFHQNYIAAYAEQRSALWGTLPPDWTLDVPPLPAPHFALGIMSWRPYLLRVAPVVWRRRNLFIEKGLGTRLATLVDGDGFDGVGYAAPLVPLAPSLRVSEEPRYRYGQEMLAADRIRELFRELEKELAAAGVGADLHVVGGAVMCLVMGAREATRDVDAIFEPAAPVREAVARIAEREGLARGWLNDAAKAFLSHTGEFSPYLDLPFLRVFVASPEYLLAMKCLAMRPADQAPDLADIRFLLRYLDIRTATDALDVIERYYPVNRISPRIKFALEEMLSPPTP
ncbi:MAG: DUF1778 domain-containing protein [Gemmatimonadaceae bacterium]